MEVSKYLRFLSEIFSELRLFLIALSPGLNQYYFFVDADCGRGFTRIENYCVNISNQMAAPNDSPTILSRCQAIQAGQLQAPTQAMLFLLQVVLTHSSDGFFF